MINFRKKDTTELLSKLVAIDSPYFQEENIVKFVINWFKTNDINAIIHDYHEEKVTGFKGQNVLVQIQGSKPGPTVCINGHLDTVMKCNGWTKDANGVIIGDKLYGLGALDMKSGCASTMVAIRAFFRNKKHFKGKIIGTYVSVEEGPYGIGTNALIEEGYLDDVDVSIITEPSSGFTGNPFPDVCLGARGGYGLEIEFFGVSSHAATPNLGINAVEEASKFVSELKHIDYVYDEHLGKGDVCVIAFNSDGGACSVPDYAKIKLFWHIVIDEDESTIIRNINITMKKADVQCEYKINFRESPSQGSKGFLPYTISNEEYYTKAFLETVEEVCHRKPSQSYFQSIGDFNYLGSRLDAPAILFGADGANFHASDEYVELDTVYDTAKVIYKYLENILCE